MTLSEAFAQLGLPPDSDGRAVRRAYAQLLKGLDQVSQPQAFMELRAAYERSEEHTSELQSLTNLVCRLLLEKKNIPAYSLPNHTKWSGLELEPTVLVLECT